MTATLLESPLTAAVCNALDELRPLIQRDGGDVELLGIDAGVVTVRLQGHCVGCPMSQQTLKAGIQAHLIKRVPEVVRVEQAQAIVETLRENKTQTVTQTPAMLCVSAPIQDNSPTSKMRAEHRITRAALKLLEAALQRICSSRNGPAQADLDEARDVYGHLRGSFSRHMDFEEKVLFNKLEPLISWGKPTLALVKEHAQLRAEIAAFGASLSENAAPGEFSALGGALINSVRNHLYREENTVYFEADGLLDGN